MLPSYPVPQTDRPAKVVRRHARVLYSIPLTLHHLAPGGVQVAHGISLDISESGLGALVQGGLRVGETVSLGLALPQYALNAVAIVRHSSTVQSGFEFVGLTAEERQRIASMVASA